MDQCASSGRAVWGSCHWRTTHTQSTRGVPNSTVSPLDASRAPLRLLNDANRATHPAGSISHALKSITHPGFDTSKLEFVFFAGAT
jgi:hypothetical protein